MRMRDLMAIVEAGEPPAAIGTPAFKRWFGASKVVDDDGKPLVVYHGTLANIETFIPGDGRNGRALGSNVIYLTADPRDASDYGRESSQEARAAGRRYPKMFSPGANVLPCYVRLEKPLAHKPEMPIGNELVQKAQREGHDGIIYSTGRDVVNRFREIVVFRPDQIKSVFAREFNPQSPKLSEGDGSMPETTR